MKLQSFYQAPQKYDAVNGSPLFGFIPFKQTFSAKQHKAPVPSQIARFRAEAIGLTANHRADPVTRGRRP